MPSVLTGFDERGGAVRRLISDMILRVFLEYVFCEFEVRKVRGGWHWVLYEGVMKSLQDLTSLVRFYGSYLVNA